MSSSLYFYVQAVPINYPAIIIMLVTFTLKLSHKLRILATCDKIYGFSLLFKNDVSTNNFYAYSCMLFSVI